MIGSQSNLENGVYTNLFFSVNDMTEKEIAVSNVNPSEKLDSYYNNCHFNSKTHPTYFAAYYHEGKGSLTVKVLVNHNVYTVENVRGKDEVNEIIKNLSQLNAEKVVVNLVVLS